MQVSITPEGILSTRMKLCHHIQTLFSLGLVKISARLRRSEMYNQKIPTPYKSKERRVKRGRIGMAYFGRRITTHRITGEAFAGTMPMAMIGIVTNLQ